MIQEIKLSLIEKVNAITQLNMLYLTKLGEIGEDGLTDDQKKLLADASIKLSQAGSKILEACK